MNWFDRLMDSNWWPVVLIGTVVLAVWVFNRVAYGHEFTDPKWTYCCEDRHCKQVPEEMIDQAPNGYMLHTPLWSGFIPFSESTPSPDDHYWLCLPGGVRGCFFAPKPRIM